MNPLAIFRADASPSIGSGHVIRCLILAKELASRGFDIVFTTLHMPGNLLARIQAAGYSHILLTDHTGAELEKKINGQGQASNRILIIDSDNPEYLAVHFQKRVRSGRWVLMYFTFFEKYEYLADIILNQNARAPFLQYNTAEYTWKLLGLDYLILNEQFQKSGRLAPAYNKKEEVLFLFFGGADSKHRTLLVLNAILHKASTFKRIITVAGSLNKDLNELNRLSREYPEVELYVNTDKMATLMSASKYAICSGGLSLWELAACRVLQIVMPTSDRERLTLEYCQEKNWVHAIYEPESLTPPELSRTIFDMLKEEGNQGKVERFENEINTNGTRKVAEVIQRVLNERTH